MTMLYERWCEVAAEHSHSLALWDLGVGQQWTFGELARYVDQLPICEAKLVYPQSHSADFVFTVLRAWRDKAVVCPLEANQHPLLPQIPPSNCCHLKTTSATSGQPRQIVFRAEQLAADAENITHTMGLRPDWPNLGVISLAHSYGFSNLILPLLLHGIPLLLLPSPLPEALRKAAAISPALTLPAVPALWSAWQDSGAIPEQVRLAISAGAPLAKPLETAVFERFGLKIHNFYGSSECGGIAFDSSSVPRAEDDCVGSPMRNVRVCLNKEGCLRVSSLAAGETYWPEPDAALEAGQFQTNDLAEIKDGLVLLRGRMGDQINIAGRKISPASIERTLAQHAAVDDCLVFGVPSNDSDRTEIIVACVSLRRQVGADELKHFLLAKLPSWQLPRKWWFLDSLAVNSRGKRSRAEWRKKYLEDGPGT